MKQILTLGAALTTLAVSATASAQMNSVEYDQPSYLTIRGGIVLPLDNNLKDLANTFFGIGLDYTLEKALFKGGETYLSVDWISESLRGNRANIFPLLLNHRFYLGEQGALATNRTYAFVGLGAVILDLRPSSTRIGGRVGFGMELTPELVAEASLFVSDKTNTTSVRATSIGFYLGYRF